MLAGACVHLENLLGRSLLWLACRYHVLEVVLKHVFEKCCGSSTGPEIPTFKRFQSLWESLDRGSYRTLNDEEPLENALELPRVQMVTFLQTVLHDGSNPREDYDELLRLCLLFLGGSEGQIRFRAPGAYHQARWMAKAIYAVKMTLFADQLELPARIKRGLRQVALFVSLLYIKHWHEALIPEYAPKNDLELLQALNEYPDKEVGAEGTRALSRHLWYLSKDLIALAFFDDRVEDGEKKRMLENLVRPASKKALKRLEGKGLRVTNTTTLSGFVTSRSKRLFELLLDRKEPPQNLLADEALKNRVRALKVVNDSPERAIALIKQFASAVKDEGQRQYLLRVVKHHRSKVPKRTKAACSVFHPLRLDGHDPHLNFLVLDKVLKELCVDKIIFNNILHEVLDILKFLSGSLKWVFDVLGALEDPVELWDTFKRETLQAAKECIGEHPRSRRSFGLDGDAGKNRGESRSPGWLGTRISTGLCHAGLEPSWGETREVYVRISLRMSRVI
ncbi:hypothetical protein GWK47_053853 [Chionoecetes opilio]|uniref:Uncharacterized protein n=1 Tax=Chionoecetes opilio TaxID=41210 RepID=A0A8J4XYU6_CHIOP|nr:hypothetical protein GWK47_053853 [Chionoecetes opilio]